MRHISATFYAAGSIWQNSHLYDSASTVHRLERISKNNPNAYNKTQNNVKVILKIELIA